MDEGELGELAGGGLPVDEAALVVVDMQEYFCRPGSNFVRFAGVFDEDGARWYSERVAETVIPTIAGLIGRARDAGVGLWFTQFGSHQADGGDMPRWARTHNEMATDLTGGPSYPPFDDPTCGIVAELAPRSGDRIVQKVTSGPAVGTDLIHDLRSEGITTVGVTGVATNICVMGMARELADADFAVLVVEDACATVGEAVHQAALASLSTSFASVVSSADIAFRADGDEV